MWAWLKTIVGSVFGTDARDASTQTTSVTSGSEAPISQESLTPPTQQVNQAMRLTEFGSFENPRNAQKAAHSKAMEEAKKAVNEARKVARATRTVTQNSSAPTETAPKPEVTRAPKNPHERRVRFNDSAKEWDGKMANIIINNQDGDNVPTQDKRTGWKKEEYEVMKKAEAIRQPLENSLEKLSPVGNPTRKQLLNKRPLSELLPEYLPELRARRANTPPDKKSQTPNSLKEKKSENSTTDSQVRHPDHRTGVTRNGPEIWERMEEAEKAEKALAQLEASKANNKQTEHSEQPARKNKTSPCGHITYATRHSREGVASFVASLATDGTGGKGGRGAGG